MEPVFWLFRLIFLPFLPIATLARSRLKTWDVLLRDADRLDAQFTEIDAALTTPEGRPAWPMWHSSPDRLRRSIADCLSQYCKLGMDANKHRNTSKFYFQANLDARSRRLRGARFAFIMAIEQFKADAQKTPRGSD